MTATSVNLLAGLAFLFVAAPVASPFFLSTTLACQENLESTENRTTEKDSNHEKSNPQPEPAREILATVGGHEISNSVVNRFVRKRFANHPRASQQDLLEVPELQQAALEHHIRRAIMCDYLVTNNRWASAAEIRLKQNPMELQLQKIGQTIDEYAMQEGITREELDFEAAWHVSWDKFLKKTLTPQRLEKYFESERRQFDGTQLLVAHLLLKPSATEPNPQNPPSKKTRLAEAKRLHGLLAANPDSWEQVVRENSDAPSANTGGEIGWIGLQGPMPDSFTQAAFELDAGEIAPPIETAFGFHIIKCLEVKPGKIGLKDAYDEVYAAASAVVFDRLVERHRSQVEIKSPDAPPLNNEK